MISVDMINSFFTPLIQQAASIQMLICAEVTTPQFLQKVVNNYCYSHQVYVFVGQGDRLWFTHLTVSNKCFHPYPRQSRESSD